MSGLRLAPSQRELQRGSTLLLLEMLRNSERVAAVGDVTVGSLVYPAVDYRAGNQTLTVMFDRVTGLPARIRTLDYDNIWGDVTYDLVLADWHTMDGVRVASSRKYELNGRPIMEVKITEGKVNAPIAADRLAIPDAFRTGAPKPATGPVPYQWVIRRQFIGTYLDSDVPSYDTRATSGLRLVELAPGVQHVVGGSHHSLIVEMREYLIVFDAPVGDWHSKWILDAARTKYPGKPVKYLVLTHHHMDHTGGMRAFAAEGATVIVPAPDKAYFEQVIKAPHTLEPDAQQKAMKAATVQEVKDTFSIKDDVAEINLYNIPNPHVDGYLLIHVAKDNILWVTDLISPRGPVARNPQTVAVGEALRKLNITGATIAGGHGTTAKQADIAPALAMN